MTLIREFGSRDSLMQAVAARLASDLEAAISSRGAACAALSGGDTPEPAYSALAALPVDWSKVTFALVDERFVPPSHAASNEGQLRRALAAPFAAGAQLLPMFSEHVTLEAAAERANTVYAAETIDVALFGMGGDGHTASWFAHSPQISLALDAANPRNVIAVHAPGAAGASERLTLTRSAVARVGKVMLLVTGADKRRRLERACATSDAPVASLFAPPLAQPEVFWAP